MTVRNRNILIGVAAISVFAAILYFLFILIYQKKQWYDWFLSELKKSETANKLGVTNNPGAEALNNLRELSDNILWKIHKVVKGWKFTSGFRSGAVNEAVGGVQNSQHQLGQAADFKCENMKEVFEFIANNLEFDQLIWEKGNTNAPAWIHVSFRKGNNRNQVIYNY